MARVRQAWNACSTGSICYRWKRDRLMRKWYNTKEEALTNEIWGLMFRLHSIPQCKWREIISATWSTLRRHPRLLQRLRRSPDPPFSMWGLLSKMWERLRAEPREPPKSGRTEDELGGGCDSVQTRTPRQQEPVYVHMSQLKDSEKGHLAPQTGERTPQREPNPTTMTSQLKTSLSDTRTTRRGTTPPSSGPTEGTSEGHGIKKEENVQTDQAFKGAEGLRQRRVMQECELSDTQGGWTRSWACFCGMPDLPFRGEHSLEGCTPGPGHPWWDDWGSESSDTEGETSPHSETQSERMDESDTIYEVNVEAAYQPVKKATTSTKTRGGGDLAGAHRVLPSLPGSGDVSGHSSPAPERKEATGTQERQTAVDMGSPLYILKQQDTFTRPPELNQGTLERLSDSWRVTLVNTTVAITLVTAVTSLLWLAIYKWL